MTDAVYSQAVQYFLSLVRSEYCKKATLYLIKQYEAFYEKQKNKLKQIEPKDKRKLKHLSFNYDELLRYFKEYKNENDLQAIFNNRMYDYKKARLVLNAIADTEDLDKDQFIDLFESLVGSKTQNNLWHSGSIYRKKSDVFRYPREFQELVRYIRGNRRETASYLFINAKRLVNKIKGSGINTVTEIMMTYNYKDFANLNANPIKVLREAGGVHLKAHRNSFNGEDYEEYCELVKEIRSAFDLRNMLEADSFFNNVYWQLVRK